MNSSGNTYVLQQKTTDSDLTFLFVSKGINDMIKMVQYSFVQKLYGKNVYYLGFGDYDMDSEDIIDNIVTNNGDAYKVFNTVLSTISIFFEHYNTAILLVQGSDGGSSFVAQCKKICNKKCVDECRNHNRRISIYRGYVDKTTKD